MTTYADASTKRFSVILSGAISLGAYEAGVISQIAYTLAAWNAERAQANQPPIAIIDVIAGASAGALTGAMLAAHIMNGTDPKAFAQANYDAWCSNTTTFTHLLETEDRHALLSSAVVDQELNNRCVAPLYNPANRHPERILQHELLYTCTLTSLKPIPFVIPTLNGAMSPADSERDDPDANSIQGATYRDWMTFSILEGGSVAEVPNYTSRTSAPHRIHEVSWERLVNAAIASGCFPFAFQPYTITRFDADYPCPHGGLVDDCGYHQGLVHNGERQPGNCVTMQYTDGGTIDNMPMKRAVETLPSFMAENWEATEDRSYIFIQPIPYRAEGRCWVCGPESAEIITPSESRDQDTSCLHMLGILFNAMREQSFYQDIADSQKINRRLAARDMHAVPALVTSIQAISSDNIDAAITGVQTALAAVLDGSHRKRSVEEELGAYQGMARQAGPLQQAYEMLCDPQKPTEESKPQQLLLLQLALLDNIAGLRDKSYIHIERICPQEPETDFLAGELLGSFGDFLSPDMGTWDFHQGLVHGAVWLTQWMKQHPALSLDSLQTLTITDLDLHGANLERGKWLARLPLDQMPGDMMNALRDPAVHRIVKFLQSETADSPFFNSLCTGLMGNLLEFLLSHLAHFPNNPDYQSQVAGSRR